MVASAQPGVRPEKRPAQFAKLLLSPITENPLEDSGPAVGWPEEHCTYRRFYVAGTGWLQNNSGLNANRISQFREEGVRRLNELTESGEIDWRNIPGMQSDDTRYWADISRQQFNAAFNGSPMFLSKALYVLMACELAVEDALARKTRLPNIQQPIIREAGDIYRVMGIIPACWCVTSFNTANLDLAIEKDGEFLSKIARFCGQGGNTGFLRELATGATVQYGTAAAVAEYCAKERKIFGADVSVRVQRLGKLGTKGAAESENVDRG